MYRSIKAPVSITDLTIGLTSSDLSSVRKDEMQNHLRKILTTKIEG